MELVIYQPTEDQFIKEISFNFDELHDELKFRLTKYEGLVYTDDSIKSAKLDRAALNKFKDALETKRKEIKNQCLAPYEEFEKKIKELVALVDQPILAIDGQIKAYEQQLKDEKQARLEAHYLENIGDLKELLPFERIFDKKWLNATFSFASACVSISDTIAQVGSDLKTIADLQSEFELQIKDTYLKSLNLSTALNEKTRLEQQKAKLEEYNRQQQAKTEAEKSKSEEAEPAPMAKPATVEPQPKDMFQPEKYYRLCFWADLTSEQIGSLKAFFIENKINYGKIERTVA